MSQDSSEAGSPARRVDLNAIWARSVVLMRDNIQLLAVLGGVFILLPSAAVYLVLPPSAELQGPLEVMTDPASSEAAILAASEAVSEIMQPFIGWILLLSALQHVGYGALMALLGPARPTVGQAIGRGLKAIIPLGLAMFAFAAGWLLVLFVLGLALSPLGEAASALVGTIGGFLIGLFLAARLSLTLPVMTIEETYNPLAALARSWKLTAASRRRVFAFWLLIFLAYSVIFILVSGLGGLLAALAPSAQSGGLILGLITGCFGLASGIVICACAAAMLAQLGGTSARSDRDDPGARKGD